MSPENIVAIATGTTGLTAFLMYVAKMLWAEHQRDDADVRAQRDELKVALREQTAGNKQMAEAVVDLTAQIKRLAGKLKP